VRDRDQVKIEYIGASYFLESREFARGVDDVRGGRPARFDDYAWDQGNIPETNRQWAYEKGRQFATSFGIGVAQNTNFSSAAAFVALPRGRHRSRR
jgi:hypothetical protein